MKRLVTLFILVTTLLLASCNDGPVGIFASIASEAAVTYSGSESFRKATPATVVQRGTTLFAVITQLYKKNDTTWVKATDLPSNAFYATSAAVIGTKLYVSFFDSNVRSLGVWETSDNSTWVRTDNTFPASGKQIQQLIATNGKLFAVTSSNTIDNKTEYVLYELSGSTFTERKTGSTNLFYVIEKDGTYYVASGANIWTTSDFSSYSDPASLTLSDSGNYVTGLAIIDSKPTATTALGKIYWFTGSTWTSTTSSLTVSSNELYLSSMVEHAGTLFIATNSVPRKVDGNTKIAPAAGYVELSLPLSASSTQQDPTNKTNFSSTIGSTALSMLTLIMENGTPIMYAGSVGNGLWSNKYTDSAWSGWQRETD